MTVKKVGCYVRVSTLMQDVDKEAGSLVTQESLLRNFVEQKNALSNDERWCVAEIYRESASAKDTHRREFQRMMRDIAEGRVNCVVFTKLDRISRSTQDLLRIVQHFEAFKCEFYSLQEDLNTTGPMGRFLITLLAALAELERATIAERVRGKMNWRAEVAHLWNGGVPRLGYDSDPDNKGVLTPNNEERVIVQATFETYLATASLRETARKLNEQGWRTKKYRSRRGLSQGGKRFSKSTVQRILTDEVYLGKQQHKGRWLEAKHQPLVERKLFDEVQALLTRQGIVRARPRTKTRFVFPLEGLLRCGCGSAMTMTWSRGKTGKEYRYYHCARQRDVGDCNASRVGADDIENIIAQRLIKLSEDPALLAMVLSQANLGHEDERKSVNDKVNALLAQLSAVSTQLDTLVDFLASGGNSNSVKERLADLETRKVGLQAELDQTREQLKTLKRKSVKLDTAKEGLNYFAKAYENATMEQRKKLFQLMLDHATLTEDRLTLAIYDIDLTQSPDPLAAEPTEIGAGQPLAFAKNCPAWWTKGDSNP
ncbi:MAG: recombinase family protein [Planctomycetes bacterium]|nr:recombinase family protein [Planctomycetota bacterium]